MPLELRTDSGENMVWVNQSRKLKSPQGWIFNLHQPSVRLVYWTDWTWNWLGNIFCNPVKMGAYSRDDVEPWGNKVLNYSHEYAHLTKNSYDYQCENAQIPLKDINHTKKGMGPRLFITASFVIRETWIKQGIYQWRSSYLLKHNWHA